MVKTTILLRDDLYAALKRRYGARRLSAAINERLSKQVLRWTAETMFGTMKRTSVRDVRDHRDHT